MTKRTATDSAAECVSCSARLRREANYCHVCGKKQGRASIIDGSVIWFAGGGAVLVIAVAGAMAVYTGMLTSGRTDSLARTPTFSATISGGPATRAPGSVDLASMSPREAADRLFNRVMSASETGNRDEALQFAPMALQAYQMVPELDADAHFHVGLISLVSGDTAGVRAEIDRLRQYSPSHLLSYYLAYEATTKESPEAKEILRQFSAAVDRELATARPEYQAHGNSIARLREIAANAVQDDGVAIEGAAIPSEGATLFVANCARCHGPGAGGTQSGPPLVHKYYEPNHHSDQAFYRAVFSGVKRHHWGFGDMPPIEGLSRRDVRKIISYVRDLQRSNGIF